MTRNAHVDCAKYAHTRLVLVVVGVPGSFPAGARVSALRAPDNARCLLLLLLLPFLGVGRSTAAARVCSGAPRRDASPYSRWRRQHRMVYHGPLLSLLFSERGASKRVGCLRRFFWLAPLCLSRAR